MFRLTGLPNAQRYSAVLKDVVKSLNGFVENNICIQF
jgi:hypothetical protein